MAALNRHVSIEREELNGVPEFVLRLDGARTGYLEYTRPEAGLLRIEYVEVAPEVRGTGLARQLVEQAVAFAADHDLRVVPVCGYARAVIARDPAMRDRLAAGA